MNVGLVDYRVWLLGIRLSSVTRASAIGVDSIHIKGAWILLTRWIMHACYLMIVLDEMFCDLFFIHLLDMLTNVFRDVSKRASVSGILITYRDLQVNPTINNFHLKVTFYQQNKARHYLI